MSSMSSSMNFYPTRFRESSEFCGASALCFEGTCSMAMCFSPTFFLASYLPYCSFISTSKMGVMAEPPTFLEIDGSPGLAAYLGLS